VRKAGNEPCANRIGNYRKHDWDRSGRSLCSQGRSRTGGHNDVNIKTDQLGGKLRELLPLSKTVLNDDVFSLNVTKIPKPLTKRLIARLKCRSRHKITYPIDLPRPLRMGYMERNQNEESNYKDTDYLLHGFVLQSKLENRKSNKKWGWLYIKEDLNSQQN
jgi:hypothetical protein